MSRKQAEEVLTLKEAAAFLKVTERTVYRLMERGELRGKKVGREWRFLREDLLAYLRANGSETPAAGEKGGLALVFA